MAATISPSSNHTSKSNITTINDLFDDSLIEIFRRLPCKSLFKCKIVSKRWFTLISNPNFHSLYICHQHNLFQNLQNKGDQNTDQNSFILKPYNALVIQYDGSLEKHLSLSFLGSDFEPTTVIPQLRCVLKFIFGYSNGLLLCGNPRPHHQCTYIICNPLTKVSSELPIAPTLCNHTGVLVGFTCDPYYSLKQDNNIVSVSTTLNRKFSVVRIPAFSDTKFSFDVEVFHSKTGKWNQFVVACPKGFACGFFLTTSSVELNGKLYFTGKGKILVYDPYNNNNEQFASVIDLPSEFGEVYRGCLGVSCGSLWLSEYPIANGNMNNVYSGRVWELQCCDYGATWRLEHEFYLPDIVGPIFEELKVTEREYLRGCSRILAFHLYIKDTVFLKFGDYILSCNLLTHRFKATKYDGLSLVFYPITPIVLPWWPTPIPLVPLLVDR